jgi:iron complex outermembrane recepter protein
MSRRVAVAVAVALPSLSPLGLMAQTNEPDLAEVLVVAAQTRTRVLQPVLTLNEDALRDRLPISAADIFHGVPGVGVRMNSRGETVVRIRSAGERQTQIYLDGAPLAVPWDGRVDLGLLPAGVLSSVQVINSAAPIEYGANAVLGVVDLTTSTPDNTGLRNAQAGVGEFDAFNAGASYGARGDILSILVAGSMNRRNGNGRLNTDLRSTSAFAGLGARGERVDARVSVFTSSAERGIAPEAHLNSATDNPRYWRYPDWSLTQTTLNARLRQSGDWSLRGVVWFQDFNQTIDRYADSSYTERRAREENADQTFGTRLIAGLQRDVWGVRVVTNLQRTTHRQTDSTYPDISADQLAVFRQDLSSIGVEGDYKFSERMGLSVGASHDSVASPLTGGRAAQPELSAVALSASASLQLQPEWLLTASYGRRTRFPTLRELYGEALGSFLLNPGLQPERVEQVDLTLTWNQDVRWQIVASLWASQLDGTLAQRYLRINGKRFRQRYNQSGMDVLGAEARLAWQWSPRIRFEWNGTVQDLAARRENDGLRPEIFQRPKAQTAFALDIQPHTQWDARLEVEYVGAALDEAPDGSTARLKASTQINMRAYYKPGAADGKWSVYAAADNLTNAAIVPQLGLPAPGRSYRLGVQLTDL